MDQSDRTTRRTLLATVGTSLTALAGCFTVTENETQGASGDTTTDADDASDAEGDATTADGGADGAATATGTGDAAVLPTPVAGDPEADVTVAVFEDFACPHCRTFNEEEYPQLRSEYVEPGTIRYEHHDLPIPVDESVSWQAPNAARAVQDTVGDEAFYEYVHLLFANQRSLGPDTYASLAGEVGADGETVRSAAVNRRYDETIQADRQAGVDRGARGTPAAFVDGEQVDPTYDALSSAIEQA